MSKKIIFVLGFVLVSGFGFCQGGRIKGQMGVGVSGGIGDRTMVYQLEYYYSVLSQLFLNASLYTTQMQPGVAEKNPYSFSRYGLDLSAHYSPLVFKDRFFFTPFLGIGMVYFSGSYPDGDLTVPDQVKFAVLGGCEVEARISSRVFIYLAGEAHYSVGPAYGEWWPTGRLGLRVSF